MARDTFHWADYVVAGASFAISLGIGIFFAVKDYRKQSLNDMLMAGGKLAVRSSIIDSHLPL